ncbi:MAG: UvrD-helicase domain-containing protein, partial [Clostridia bacterium]|nr:UvrD-helicase domain-containing protein [Clostridia bacterium]
MEENKIVEIENVDVQDKVSLTDAQRRAIEAKGLVMVSASAGSGKTHTMLERIMHLIEEGVGLDKMLILVYNEANASELREKIRSKLFEKASECVGERAEAYRKQLVEIAFSTICTIHAFCRSALKKNFAAIGINPDFDILDETAHKVYMSKALDKTFEEFASNGDKTFYDVSSIF